MELNLKHFLLDRYQVSEEEFEQLAPLINIRHFEKEALLLQPGMVCEHIFFVEKGLLRTYTIAKNGKEHILQFAPETWFIGDRGSYYFNMPSEFFIQAIEPSTVILLSNDFFEKANTISPAFRFNNQKAMQNHIMHQQQRINLLLGATAEERYLDFIRMYPNLTLRVPQWMMASYLGITPESLSRVRKELAHRNFKPQ